MHSVGLNVGYGICFPAVEDATTWIHECKFFVCLMVLPVAIDPGKAGVYLPSPNQVLIP